MLISYKWLQSYFDEKLPEPEKLAELITFSFAEVESVEKKGEDAILDIKVLPDRACYALSHRGVAYEISAITGLPKKEMKRPQPKVEKVRAIAVRVEAPELCSRYMARVIWNITPKELPWVKEHLEAVGQRTIHPVVDGANIVMFDMGQPLHAFDADKVEGGISVRRARKGEKIVTLDNRMVELDEEVLVIADEKVPLAIAGIKGGTKAAVTNATKNLILESANFNAAHIRKTAERLGIKTDASKRFENKLSPELASVGMDDFTALLFEMDSPRRIKAGETIDQYPKPPEPTRIEITPGYISQKLGLRISSEEMEQMLRRLEIGLEKKGERWILTPPLFRADLAIPEDIAEEAGRLIGYHNIPVVLPPKSKAKTEIPKSFYCEWKIREILTNAGFSEVMTSSFSERGDSAIEKPLAEDKRYARENLRGNFEKALKMNALNAPLFGVDETRIFEIGQVFPKGGEHTALAIGYAGARKKGRAAVGEMIELLARELGIDISGGEQDGVFEYNLDTVFEKLPEPKQWDIAIPPVQSEKFRPFPPFPFIVRDVALFVSPKTTVESAATVIREHAGELVVRGPELFDEFTKDGKKSLAFRMVFQSFKQTLQDEEVNKQMEKVYSALKGKGWEVR